MTLKEQIIRCAIAATVAIVTIVVFSLLLKKRSKKSRSLHSRYLLQVIRLVILILCAVDLVSIFDPTLDVSKILLRGSALVVAVVGFAAQPAISDLICGLLISINKPFEIGDRIVVEGLDPGIVDDITLRHTVLRIYDDLRIIVPNSELNSKTVTNTSYHQSDRRGIHLQYSVSYDTDVQKAMDIIRDCVVESPYTLSVENNGILEDSGPVYFLKFADSALLLDTTIWVTKNTNSYTAITDINIRVNTAFKANNIEIPYNYVNVVEYEGTKDEEQEQEAGAKKKTAPSRRHYRTNTVKLTASLAHAGEAIRVADRYAAKQRLDENEKMQLELLSEEALGVIGAIIEDARTDFWIEGSGLKYRIHIRFDAKVGSDEYKKLVSLSSTGKNEAISGFTGKIWEVMTNGLGVRSDSSADEKGNYEWNLKANDDISMEFGESILASIASDIRVSIEHEVVEFIVIKSMKPSQV